MASVTSLLCYILCLYIFVFLGTHGLSTYTLQACYGNGFEDYMSPSCPVGYKIYVYDVYTYSKRSDRNCPVIADATNRNITYCCNYVNETEDCGKRYYGTAHAYEHEHYSRCSGRQDCGLGVQASWNFTNDVCNSSVFMEKSNYMKMWYNCLPDSAVISISNATFTAQSVFLSNEGYPLEMSSCGTTSGATCEVTASGTSTIRITGFDLQFYESSGECKQRLLITDNTSVFDVACDDINDFARTTLYTSRTNSITIRLDNTATSGGGKFWIHLEASNSSDELSVQCRNSTPVVSCNDTLKILNLTTTTQTSLSLSTISGTESSTTLGLTDSSVSSGTSDVITTDSTSITDVVTHASATVDTITTEITTDSSTGTTFSVVNSNDGNDTFTSLTNSAGSTTANHRTLTMTSSSTDSTLNIASQTLTPVNGTDKSTIQSFGNKNVPNDNKQDSALLPALGAMLGSIAAAGLMFYLYWRHKKKKAHQVLDDSLDPALQSHLPVISSLPPARQTTLAWDDGGGDKICSPNKYVKEPTLISLQIHD